MKNLLLQIIDTIIENKWCFKHNGACSTCGMMDVKNELKKYNIDKIIEAFEELNFEDTDVAENIVGLEKLYSLMTGPYTVWNAKSKINRLNISLNSKEYDHPYLSRILASDYNTYWTKWEAKSKENQKLFEAQENKRQELGKKRKEHIAHLKENDQRDRKNGTRDILIEKLNKMTTYDKLVLMAEDTEHTCKFYPGNIAHETIPEYINMLNDKQYEGLCKLFEMPVKGPSPWASFKKKYFKE